MNAKALVTISLLSLFAHACGEDGGGSKPTIKTFSASKTTVQAGEMITLTWNVEGAATIVITANPGGQLVSTSEAMGTRMATINANTSFTLSATNPQGSSTQTVTVMVMGVEVPAPKIDAFTASMMMVAPNTDVTLTWQTTDAVSVDISDGSTNVVTGGAGDGTQVVRPAATTTYTLTAKGMGDQPMMVTASVTITVEIIPPPMPEITSFTANPTAILVGESSTLSWTVMNATRIVIVDDAMAEIYNGADLMGTQIVMPSVMTPPGSVTYTMTASNDDNESVTAMVTIMIDVEPVPVINSFVATPDTINVGETSVLSWDVSGQQTIEISDGVMLIHTNTAATGTFDVQPFMTRTYTLTAKDDNGDEVTAMATVTVNAGPPPIFSFTASPNPIPLGTATTLSWNTVTATVVHVFTNGVHTYETVNNMGTLSVTPTATVTEYTLQTSNLTGRNEETVTVHAHAAPVINSFTALPVVYPSGGSVTATITWDVSSVATLQLFANGVAAPGFTPINALPGTTSSAGEIYVTVSTPTTFSLVASSAAGTASAVAEIGELVISNEPNDTPLTASPIMPGPVVAGAINPAGDVDWYSVVVPANGWLVAATTNPSGGCDTLMDTQLYVYNSTDADQLIAFNEDVGPGRWCSLASPFFSPPTITETGLQELPAGTYYIRVQAYSTLQTFDYLFSVEVGTAACGNGLTERSLMEQCDDGNTTDSDGCSATCQYEINPTVIRAPGGTVSVTMPPNGFHLVTVEITNPGQSITATAADANGACDLVETDIALGDDQFLLIGAKANGGPTGAAGDCGAIHFPADTFGIGLESGIYYLAIFNNSATAGTVTLNVGVIEPQCGDNILTPPSGETCEPPGGICDASCQVIVATIPNTGPQIYPGSIPVVAQHDFIPLTVTTETYVVASVFVPDVSSVCFDDPGVALTDSTQTTRLAESITPSGDACAVIGPSLATRVGPGTYFLEVWDNGDDGIIPSYELVIDSRPIDVCGNGVVDGMEPCDDGNTVAGDGCNNCVAEAAVCGDTIVQPGESCDDGNLIDGDGCNSTCDIEAACVNPLIAVVGPQSGDTTFGAALESTLCDGYNQPGTEQVWEFQATTTGNVTITVQPTNGADLSVYARSPSCELNSDTIDCQDLGFSGDPESITISVVTGDIYYIIVDSYTTFSYGTYDLTITP